MSWKKPLTSRVPRFNMTIVFGLNDRGAHIVFMLKCHIYFGRKMWLTTQKLPGSSAPRYAQGESSSQKGARMSRQADEIFEEEMREYWWEQGEAVMKEMTEED